MPPRHAYWTILIDDQPTAFRAHDAEELLPTLNRLREKNGSAVMKWFERGKLFDSRDQAREVGLGEGERRWEGPRPDRDAEGPRFSREAQSHDGAGPSPKARRDDSGPGSSRGGSRPRDKNWRPGGEHRDPRQKYKDAKKAKWNRFKDKIRERHDGRGPRSPESFTPPHGDTLREQRERPRAPRTRDSWNPGPAAKRHGDPLGPRAPRPEWPRGDDRRRGSGSGGGAPDRRPWSDRPPPRDSGRDQRTWSDRPARRDDTRDQRPWSDRPPRRDGDREQRAWSDRPPRRDNVREHRPSSDRPPRRDADRQQRPWSDRPPRRENDWDRRPSSDRPPRRDDNRAARSASAPRSRDDGGGWKPKGPGGRKPAGGSDRQPWSGKPSGGGLSRANEKSRESRGPKKPWGAKPPGRPPAGRPPKRRRDDE